MSNNGKTSYVSGSNSFLAYNQDGLLNGVEYAANLVIYQRFASAFVEFTNNYEDLLLTHIAVTGWHLTGVHHLTLELTTQFNGGDITTPLWAKPYNAPNYKIGVAAFFYESFSYPFFKGDRLRFYNDDDNVSLNIGRVVMLFRPLVTKLLN